MAAERDIDPRIQRLKSTTFCGKRLTRRQIADIQETVGRFPQLSRTELGQTLCEHLGWHTPKGRNRIQLAMRVLEQLEQRGILTLPAKQGPGRGRQKPVGPAQRSAAGHRGTASRAEAVAAGGGQRRGGSGGMERMGAALPSAGLPPADRGAPALLPAGPAGAQAGLPAVRFRGAAAGLPGRVDRLGGRGAAEASGAGRAEREIPIVPVG